jgi:hypothetical protein
MRSRYAVPAAVAVLAVAALTGGGAAATADHPAGRSRCPLPAFTSGAHYHPHIDPARFGPRVTNPWFPLHVGTTYLFTGVKDGAPTVDVVTVTRRTRVVDRVRTRIVADRLFANGRLLERTSDYYAQDVCGNVWYFGEDTAELDPHGRPVDTSGSFHAGIDGAEPGVFMPARPRVGQRFRQEWYQGEAEDTFVVRDLSAPVTVPAGHFRHALRTEESTALEPGVRDVKYYVRGIGEVSEEAATGPTETLHLVETIR